MTTRRHGHAAPAAALLDALPYRLSVGPSDIAGEGLHTTCFRRAGERVAPITGEIIDADEAERRDAAGNVYIYELGEEHCIDAVDRLGRFVNHACDPTCRVEARDAASMWLVAARDLPAGTELTIDYDYPEIFEACRRHNPRCMRDACPHAGSRRGGA